MKDTLNWWRNGMCEHGHGRCTAPDTNCPHWIGTFCELDIASIDRDALRAYLIKEKGKCALQQIKLEK